MYCHGSLNKTAKVHQSALFSCSSVCECNFLSKAKRQIGKISVQKYCWNWPQMPISTAFYEQLFCTKVFGTAFMCSQFGFVIFWWKDIGAKVDHNMLLKLTSGEKISFERFLINAKARAMMLTFWFWLWISVWLRTMWRSFERLWIILEVNCFFFPQWINAFTRVWTKVVLEILRNLKLGRGIKIHIIEMTT